MGQELLADLLKLHPCDGVASDRVIVREERIVVTLSVTSHQVAHSVWVVNGLLSSLVETFAGRIAWEEDAERLVGRRVRRLCGVSCR